MRIKSGVAGMVAIAGVLAVYAVAGPLSARPVSAQGGPNNEMAQRVAELELQVAELTQRLRHVYLDEGQINGLAGPHLIIEGCNVHVRSGSGATDDLGDATIGCGNLIVGYNEDGGDQLGRTGSHNLVVGRGHTYVSYGGLVAGEWNSVTGPACSVTGGLSNVASGNLASVNGGVVNFASGDIASISGGSNCDASGVCSNVNGGYSNEASGEYATVNGGANNLASGRDATVSGGGNNTASHLLSTVAGGYFNSTVTDYNLAP